MDLRFDGKIVLVTGSSRDIGLSIAEGFASDGANLGMAARGVESLRQEAVRIGQTYDVKTHAVQADMGRTADVTNFVQECIAQFGGVDVLVNCAGDVPSSAPLLGRGGFSDCGIDPRHHLFSEQLH